MIEKHVAETTVPYEGGFFIDIRLDQRDRARAGTSADQTREAYDCLAKNLLLSRVNTVGKFWRITGPSAARFYSK